MSTRNTGRRQGFTLVEMAVVAPMVILTIGIIITVIVNITGNVLVTRYSSKMMYDVQDSLNRVETDIKLSAGFLAVSQGYLTSPQGYDDDVAAFTNVGDNGPMLILNMVATAGNPSSSTSANIYRADAPYSCSSSNVERNSLLTYTVVYFIKDETLWRRAIMPSDYLTAGCDVPWQQATCTPGVSGTLCDAEDTEVLQDISTDDFIIEYYTNAASTTGETAPVDTGLTDAERQAALDGILTANISLTNNACVTS